MNEVKKTTQRYTDNLYPALATALLDFTTPLPPFFQRPPGVSRSLRARTSNQQRPSRTEDPSRSLRRAAHQLGVVHRALPPEDHAEPDEAVHRPPDAFGGYFITTSSSQRAAAKAK
jgi:hypothetical protein